MNIKGSLARSVAVGAVAALTALAGFAFAPGAGAAANYTQVRLGGVDRFDTAAIIAAQIDEATPTAVLARADIFPDALTGAFAAAANGDGPLLLTRSDSVPARTLQALETENVDEVILLGGTAAISSAVETQLRAAGYTVSRIGGATRYDTAANIARDGAGIIGTIDGDRAAILSSGQNFPDALSGAPLSFAAGLPSLLTPPTSLHPATLSALNSLNIDQVYILGGPAAVSQDVEQALQTEGFQVTRLAGGNRSATSVEVFEFGLDKGIYTNRRFGLARGDAFPDALAYGPLGGRPRATVAPDSGVADTGGSANGLLLSAGPCTLGDEAEEFILANQATWTEGEILGGPEAICEEVADEVEQLASVGLSNITLNSTNVQPGGAISGNISGENIRSVTVSGCGFTNQNVTRDANGNFTLPNFSSTQDDCTLTFTTTFNDGRTETDQFNINVQQSGEPAVTLNPTSGQSGQTVTATYSGTRPANITNVSSSNCTIGNQQPGSPNAGQQPGQPTNSRTFTVTGAPGTTCQIVTSFTFTDAQGGSGQDTDTFFIQQTGTTPPPPSSAGGVSAGPQLATSGPDLTSVEIVNGVPNDNVDNQVRFRFDAPIQSLGTCPTPLTGVPTSTNNANCFSLQGFDSDTRLNASSVAVESGGTSVLATFGPTVDLRNFTIGTADGGAAANGSGVSVLASKALTGSAIGTNAGNTEAPVLVSATRDDTNQRITYTFDKAVQNPVASNFGFYNADGTLETAIGFAGTQPPTGAPTTIIAQFDGTPPVSTAVRFVVNDASADNTNGNTDSAVERSPATAAGNDNALGHVGAATTAPDLVSVARVAGQPNQIDFTFDLPVQIPVVDVTNFAIYNVDGTRQSGTSAVATGDARTVRVTFGGAGGPTQQNADQFTRAGVEQGAVIGTGSPNQPNTIGGLPLASFGAGAGFTDGPDLILATFLEGSNQVRFSFDQAVAQAPAPVASAFFVVNAGGSTAAVGQSAVVSGNDVTVTFAPGTLAGTVGAGVESDTGFQPGVTQFGDAVRDAPTGNNGNSPDSVGRTNG